MMFVEIVCPFCGHKHYVFCSEIGYENWLNGELIQRALPELTPTEREQLISQICPSCQEEVFGE